MVARMLARLIPSVGTRSILFGAHQFLLHPYYVALSWTELYGFPWDPRLWVAFFTHDLGYWQKTRMDDDEGERHVEFGAALMALLFGHEWGRFSLLHSRFYAKKMGASYSRLCVADKYAMYRTPRWLYLPMVTLTGEVYEYMGMAGHTDKAIWHENLQLKMLQWALTHRDGGPDVITHFKDGKGVRT